MTHTALVMTAGGARGAYQAGVLRRLAEVSTRRYRSLPFDIVVGASTGAVNSIFICSHADDFSEATTQLSNTWRHLQPQDVIRSDIGAVGAHTLRWMRDLSLGAVLGSGHSGALLDTTPLHRLVQSITRPQVIQRAIDQGVLYALAVAATDMSWGQTTFFVQGAPGHPVWQKARCTTVPAVLTPEHVMASSAIPVLFEPVQLPIGRSSSWFADGCLHLSAPLSPALQLGADRIVAIGLQCKRPVPWAMHHPPTLAHTLGVSLSSIFMDHLAPDVEHLERINTLLQRGEVCRSGSMRPVDVLHIAPSVDVSDIARVYAHRMPPAVRYLLGGWGADDTSAEVLSYLLFDHHYTAELEALGYRDAAAAAPAFEALLGLTAQRRIA